MDSTTDAAPHPDSTTNTRRIELRVDVTATGRHREIAATVYLPEHIAGEHTPIAIFGLPGGGYSQGYYDMHFAGHSDYSQAEYHTRMGHIFVAMDHLGVGESSAGEAASLRIEDIAAANSAAVENIANRLIAGTLADNFPALGQLMRIGIGQSMGGCISIVMQANHRCYDAITVLGYSAIHTVVPQPTEEERELSIRGHSYNRDTPGEKLSLETSSATITDFVYPFHWEDVPADILKADMQGGYPVRKPPLPAWGSATIPHCAITMMSPGLCTTEAAAIEVPVFVGVGERDTCPTPHDEPSAYRNCRDVTLNIVPNMAHMHNFAGTRQLLWERLESWYLAVAQASGPAKR